MKDFIEIPERKNMISEVENPLEGLHSNTAEDRSWSGEHTGRNGEYQA